MDNKIMTSAEALEGAALPRCHEVHTDPTRPKASDQKMPAAMMDKPAAQKSPAQWAYERTVLYLKNFEEQLDADHEIAMGFAGDNSGVVKIEGMGYFDPDIVTFYGTDPAGGRMQLVQHVSQLSVLFRALPKQVKSAKANRIGFRLLEDLENAAKETT
jgi:hypothetical protein